MFSTIALAEQSENQKTVLFLVDASGTMQNHLPEAVKKIKAKAALLPKDAAKEIVFFDDALSFTEASKGCISDRTLQAPVRLNEEEVKFPALGGDGTITSIGAAIENSLQTMQPPQHIVLITDGRDECDSDFLAIRKRHPGAQVEVEQVGLEPNTALELLEISPLSLVVHQPITSPTGCAECDGSASLGWSEATGIERFYWLWAVLALIGAALILSIRHLSMAAHYESRTEDLRTKKRGTNEGELSLPNLRKHQTETQEGTSVWWAAMAYVFVVILGGVGISMLIQLVFSEGGEGTIPFYDNSNLDHARNMAWLVLGSPFAIAFSVLTSAPLLFAFSQYRRRFESKRTYLVEVDAAGLAENKRIKEKRDRQYRRYTNTRDNLLSAKIADPELATEFNSTDTDISALLSDVKKRAKILAQKDQLPESKSDEIISGELNRLSKYAQRFLRYSFEQYLSNLESDSLLKGSPWADLRTQLSEKQAQLAFETLKKIAKEPISDSL